MKQTCLHTITKSILIAVLLFLSQGVMAQAPQAVSYQAVIRDSGGDLVQSGPVGVKVTIRSKSKAGFSDVYSETHTTTTNANGLITIEVGRGTPVLGTFSSINWASSLLSFYLKVETDPTGGTNYTVLGQSEILSTPYSLLAQNAINVSNEDDPIFNESAAKNITTADIANWNSISLDNAYDIGRIISAENGPMEIIGTDGVLFRGIHGGGNNLSASGSGTRMFWFPKKSAFRAGAITIDQWNENNLGDYSTAFGHNTLARGNYSTALGRETEATGERSIAMGYESVASGFASTAMGTSEASGEYATAMGSSEASGDYSVAMGSLTFAGLNAATAMGYTTTASGMASTAMGDSTTASGDASTAMGHLTTAEGDASTAMGAYTIASGLVSTAMGAFASTNEQPGSFVIGDASTYGVTNTKVENSFPNQMMMRFAGGYQLYTNSTVSTGVSLSAGGSSWSSISDSTKKENFLAANGDSFLGNLSKLKLGSWNYKGQKPTEFRHYGPMAQEIFHHFGNDGIGTIGCDTTLATADMDGIMMICLQALERRTAELQKQNQALIEANHLLGLRLEAIEITVRKINAQDAVSRNTETAHKE
jgi:hypothetical protein